MTDIKSTIPVTNKIIALFILIVNIFFPGLGTIMMSCLTKEFTWINVLIGVLQAILTICIIGWVWSVVWGIICLQISTDDESERVPVNYDMALKTNYYNSFYKVESDFKPNYSDNKHF